MFVLQLYCFICQRNHAAIFKGQIMAEKTKPICKSQSLKLEDEDVQKLEKLLM